MVIRSCAIACVWVVLGACGDDGGSGADGDTTSDAANTSGGGTTGPGPGAGTEADATTGGGMTDDSGAMFIQAYAGFIDQVRLEGNLLEGNGYQLVLEANNAGYGMNMAAVDNRFSGTGFGPGYVDDGGQGYGWTTWEDNYLDDPSQPDHRGAPIDSL